MSDPGIGQSALSTMQRQLRQVDAMPWAKRQQLSVIGSVVAALLGLGCTMIGGALQYKASFNNDISLLGIALVFLGVLMLFAAAAAGRIAGRGPFVAGVLCGVLGAIALLSPDTFGDLVRFIPLYEFQLGVRGYVEALLPAAAAMLIGAGISGRSPGGEAGVGGADGSGGATTGSTSPGPIVEL